MAADLNPMDSHKDIHPWPWSWHYVQFDDPLPLPAGRHAFLAGLDIAYDKEQIAVWTYENHWAHTSDPATPRYQYVLDIYELGSSGRDQMGVQLGHEIADYIVENLSDYIRFLIWMGRSWDPVGGWQTWTGPQGDFVDHIHVELDSTHLTE